MYPRDSNKTGPNIHTSQRGTVQRYTLKTKLGKFIEIHDDGISKFDRVIGKLGEIEEGDRVYLAKDSICKGTVKWIGRFHLEHGAEVDESNFIVGVKLDSMEHASQKQYPCTHGALNGEILVQTTHQDILFEYVTKWVPIDDSARKAMSAKNWKDLTQTAEDPHDGPIRQSPGSKFNRFDLDVNGFHVGSRVKLETGSVGIVRWIGCFHKNVVKLRDYIVGVELDSTSKEKASNLTNGWFESERLVESKRNNIKFTKLKHLSNVAEEANPSTTSAAAKDKQSTVKTSDGSTILIYHDGKSAYDRVLSGVAGIQEGDKVHLYTHKARTGTVMWIGCDHGKASKTDPKDFLVGVEVDKPEKEYNGKLTDGTHSDERLVISQKKNVLFVKLQHCNLLKRVDVKPKVNRTDFKPALKNSTKRKLEEKWSNIPTLDGIHVEIYHDGKSLFDRVCSGIDGIKEGDKVYLYSDKDSTGTLKWIGCDHNQAFETNSKDFLVGVELDSAKTEPADTLTNGIFGTERLVLSQRKNVVFTMLQRCTLVDKDKPSMITELNKIPIEIYHDDKSEFVDVCCGDRVQLFSVQARTGTVRWLGIHQNKTANTDRQEFLAGVEVDKPDIEPKDTLTDGTYCGKRLVNSQKKNVVFVSLQYCALVDHADKKPDAVKQTKRFAEDGWSNVGTVDDIPIEIYHDGKSAFDRVCSGIAGIKEGDKVYLYSDNTRTGTVKWIGCDHNCASKTDPKEFLVGVEVDRPDKELYGIPTDGTWCSERLVISERKNIMFLKLRYCTLVTNSEKKNEMTNGTKAQLNDGWSTVMTLDDIPIEIYHDGKSAFDRVCSGIAGIQNGDRVQLYSDTTRTGTVKWIGCDRGQASKRDPKEFLIGVEMDKPEKEQYKALTYGNYYGEQLVTSSERNVRFTKLKYWALIEHERKPDANNASKSQSCELWTAKIWNGYSVEFYHDGKSAFDKVCSVIAGIRSEDRVHLYSNKRVTGTVKWLGCYHGRASETDHNDFFVGVQMDKPDSEYPEKPTDGTYFGERLVHSQKKNVVFTTLKYWTLAGQTGMIPDPTNTTQHRNDVPPPDAKDSNLPPEVNNTPDRDTYPNDPAVNKSTKEAELLELNRTSEDLKRRQLSLALHHAAAGCNQRGVEGYASGHGLDTEYNMDTTNMQYSTQYPFGRGDQTTEDFTYERPDSIVGENLSIGGSKPIGRQNSRNIGMSIERQNSYDGQSYRDNNSRPLAIQSVKQPIPQPRHPAKSMQPSDVPVQPPTPSSQKPPCADLRVDLGPISKVKLPSKEEANVFIENDPHKLLPDAKQKVASEIQKVKPTDISFKGNVRGNTTTHETVRYGTPQPTTAPVPVSSQSTNDYLPMDTEHFAEHDYSWTRDQFDAGFLLRGTATQQGDKTYYTAIVALKPSEKGLADESGEPLEDVVNEVVLPPTHPEQYNDFWKGVQGDLNSCYMDTSMFAMFSYLTVFDGILYGKGAKTDHSKGEDVRRTENIRQVLRTQIVNPLRKYGLAQKKGMHELRNLLDEWGLVKGLTGDEKDPEEFLNLLLVNTFATPSPIVLSNGQESHLFHLLAEKEDGMDFPTVQELVERTCLQENFKFSKIPPYLILHLPRFGKDFKMYEQIMPSLELDVTDVISGTSQSCYVCEAVATHECYGCYKACYNISGSCFCSDCVEKYHRAPTRRDHKPQKLIVADKDDGLATAKCVLKLAAVLCIETSHYVTFVASDTTAAARWYFFDSMADREGTTNIPQVREVPQFRKHLSEAKKSVDGVPPLIRRLVKDGYICFYTNPDVPQYYAMDTPLNVTMPSGTTNL